VQRLDTDALKAAEPLVYQRYLRDTRVRTFRLLSKRDDEPNTQPATNPEPADGRSTAGMPGHDIRSPAAPQHFVCSECRRAPDPDENPADDWRAESDGTGELHVFCPECWQHEFGAPPGSRAADGW